jgi:hypothetical protein
MRLGFSHPEIVGVQHTMAWMNLTDMSQKTCTSKEQNTYFKKLSKILTYGDEDMIYNLTGCTIDCQRQEYSRQLLDSLYNTQW